MHVEKIHGVCRRSRHFPGPFGMLPSYLQARVDEVKKGPCMDWWAYASCLAVKAKDVQICSTFGLRLSICGLVSDQEFALVGQG